MKKVSTLLASLLLALGIFSTSAQASQCKGISKSACTNSLDCSWVKPYTRKDGAKIKGHCRTAKGKGKAKAKNQETKTKAKAKKGAMKEKVTKEKTKAKSKVDKKKP